MKLNNLSAQESLALLERLTSELKSFSQRESGFERAVQLRDSSARQSVADHQDEIKKRFGAAVARLKEQVADQREVVARVFEQRGARLDRAQIEVRNHVISQIQQTEGQHKGQLQRSYMDAGKKRESSLAGSATEYQERSLEAVNVNNRLVKLEKESVWSLRGFRSQQQRLIAALKGSSESSSKPVHAAKLYELQGDLHEQCKQFRKLPLVALGNSIPLSIQLFLVLSIAGALPFVASMLGGMTVPYAISLGVGGAVAILLGVLFWLGKKQAVAFVESFEEPLVESKWQRIQLKAAVEAQQVARVKAIEAEFESVKTKFKQGLKSGSGAGSEGEKYDGPESVEERVKELRARFGVAQKSREDSVSRALKQSIAQAEQVKDQELEALAAGTGSGSIEDLEQQFGAMVEEWRSSALPAHELLTKESQRVTEGLSWLNQGPDQWQVPTQLSEVLTIGSLRYSGEEGEMVLPSSPELQLGEEPAYELPLRLRIPDAASVLLETKQHGREESIGFLNFLSLGWLAAAPPGRLSFSFVDPVGLGESFAGLMHLSDYEEVLINARIRTQEAQIEERLGELCEHMEKVIQMYLRQDFETITQYNEAAGTIAERYHFLVVADFPKGFSDTATKRLLSIASSGARCGVFLMIHCDQRAELPPGFQMDDLQRACLCFRSNIDGFYLKDNPLKGSALTLEVPPPADQFAKWVHRIGEANRDSNRIEVPFSFIAPEAGEMWSADTSRELTVPIGRSGATKLQKLALGKGTCQHALIAGKTGSGKSTLFHVIVTNLTLWCDPDEVEFYLIDFKKGVEFKCYADSQVPHARVIAIESDREFGLSVLKRLDEELKTRGEMFRDAGVQDIPGYRASADAQPMPRTLLLIDEFQEFFVEDDQISQQAAVLLDRIVRQGRAFGIHAVLGSQTLGGAFTLARATLGQMTVRIALACNEADAYLIMDDSNPAPRLLTRPGEGIYNDRAGAIEANSPFQVVWMEDGERDRYLAEVRARAEATGKTGRSQVIFEGNAPGDVTRDSAVKKFLAEPHQSPVRLFLGAPNAIKGPTEVGFARQSGSNLLVVGQRDDIVDSLVAIGLQLLRSQLGDRGRLVLLDHRFSQSGEDSWFASAVESIGGVECPGMNDAGKVLSELVSEMKAAEASGGNAGQPDTFVFIPSLHRYKKLRYEEDFSFSADEEAEAKPSDSLHELICEGPAWGFHVVTSLDSYNSVNRCLGRKAAGEFEKKVLFQMSATDSASLIDTGAAADLGLNRAIFYDEPTGTVEIFRPYAQPSLQWFGSKG